MNHPTMITSSRDSHGSGGDYGAGDMIRYEGENELAYRLIEERFEEKNRRKSMNPRKKRKREE